VRTFHSSSLTRSFTDTGFLACLLVSLVTAMMPPYEVSPPGLPADRETIYSPARILAISRARSGGFDFKSPVL
jgi:hypothetical protein